MPLDPSDPKGATAFLGGLFQTLGLSDGDGIDTSGLQEALSKDPLIIAAWEKYQIAQASSVLKSFTRDELGFVEKLKKSGELAKLQVADELSMRSVGPAQIRDAIADMDQYTDAAKRQLEAHRIHIARNQAVVQMGKCGLQQRKRLLDEKEKELLMSKVVLEQTVNAAEEQIERGVNALELLLSTCDEKNSPSILTTNQKLIYDPKYAPSILRASFDKDPSPYDHLLDKLQAIGWEIKCQSSEDEKLVEEARRVAGEHIYFMVHHCRGALNMSLVESIRTYSSNSPMIQPYSQAIHSELLATNEQIQSLWEEVVPVAHMATEKVFLEPILKRMDLKKQKADIHKGIVIAYVAGCLNFINERLQILASRLSIAGYHHQSKLVAYKCAKLSKTFDVKTGEKVMNQQQSSMHINDFRQLIVPNKSPRESPLGIIHKLMQDFAGFDSVTGVHRYDPQGPPMKQVTKLNEFVQQVQVSKGDETYANVHRLYEAAVKARLDERELTSRMLFDSIVADSTVSSGAPAAALLDYHTEESVRALENEYQGVLQMLKDLNLCGTKIFSYKVVPMLKIALKDLDQGHGSDCWKTHSENMTCTQCINTTNLVKMLRDWGEE